MKKENSLEILNEIILKMNYDSSMTLSENKLILLEQLNPPYKRKETNRQRQDIYDNYFRDLTQIYQQIMDLSRLPKDKQSENISNYGNLWGRWKQLTSFLVYDKELQEDEDVIKKAINRVGLSVQGNNIVNSKTINDTAGYYYLPQSGKLSFSMTKPYMALPLDSYIKTKGIKKVNNSYTVPNVISPNEQYTLWGIYSKPPLFTPTLPNLKFPNPMNSVDETKDFQDWLDFYKPTWFSNDGKLLNKDTNSGYGNFGPKTKAAWEKYKNEYQTKGFLMGYREILRRWDVTDEKYAYAQIPGYGGIGDAFDKEISEFKDKFRTSFGLEKFRYYFPKDYRNFVEQENAAVTEFVNSMYNDELNILNKKYDELFQFEQNPPPYPEYQSPQYMVWIGKYRKMRKDYDAELAALNEKYSKTKYKSEQLVDIGGEEIPQSSTIFNFSKNDFSSVAALRNAFATNLSDTDLSNFVAPNNWIPKRKFDKNLYYTEQGFQGPVESGDLKWLADWAEDWNISGFRLPKPYSSMIFKRALIKEGGQYTVKPKGFYVFNEFDELVQYDKSFIWDSTFWERNGSFILSIGSLIIAIASQSWPAIVAAALIDTGAAVVDIKNGDNIGGTVGFLFALLPVIGKLGITYKSAELAGIAKKFKNVKNQSQFQKVFEGLSESEKKIFKDAFDVDREKLLAAIKNYKNKPADLVRIIKESGVLKAVKIPKSDLSVGLRRRSFEIKTGISALALSYPLSKKQEYLKMKKEEFLKFLFEKTLYGAIMQTFMDEIGLNIADVVKNGISGGEQSKMEAEQKKHTEEPVLTPEEKDEADELVEDFNIEEGVKIINNIIKTPSDTVTTQMIDTVNNSFPKLIKQK